MPSPSSTPASLDWETRARRNRERLDPVVLPHLSRKNRGEKHPVIDFLFQYYRFRPGELRRWSAGAGRFIPGQPLPEEAFSSAIRSGPGGWGIHWEDFPARRLEELRWTIDLLERILARPAFTGCFGLHEWAMICDAGDIRHQQLPLRVSHDQVRRVVDTGPVRCSHYDAFRFFSRAARPLNRQQPAPDDRANQEQGGCLHVNMDLFKWAYKFYPWVESELITATFLHALDCRVLDMEASPYDVRGLGYGAVEIETEAGRARYRERQKALAEASVPLRETLLASLRRIEARVG